MTASRDSSKSKSVPIAIMLLLAKSKRLAVKISLALFDGADCQPLPVTMVWAAIIACSTWLSLHASGAFTATDGQMLAGRDATYRPL